MPEIALDPPSLSRYRLFLEYEIKQFQWLGPDLFCFAAQHASASRTVLGNARGRRHLSPGAGLRYNRKKNLAADPLQTAM